MNDGFFCIMADTLLVDEYYLRLLRLMEVNPNVSQRELSRELGISLGKTNYCVKHLLDKGFIKMQNFRNSRNKLAYAYLLTPTGISAKVDLTVRFLKQKIREYESLKTEIELLRQEVDAPIAAKKSIHEHP